MLNSSKWIVQILAALVCVLASVSTVSAQDLSPEEIERFKELMTAGSEAYSEGEYQKSIDLLKEAQTIYDHPDLVYNIGRALTRLRRCDEARRAFVTYLQRPEITEQDDEKARENLAELSECVTPATLAVRCDPESATVTLDDTKQSTCPAEFEVEPGEHTVSIAAEEHASRREVRTLQEGETVTIEVTLEPLETERVTPPPSDTEPEPKSDWRPLAGWGALGAGVAFLATGVVIDSSSVGRATRLREAAEQGDDDALADLQRKGRTARAATIGLYVGGLVAAATGGALLFWVNSDETDTAAGATVTLKFR